MAGTVATDLAFFQGTGNQSDCDTTTNWVTAPTQDLETFVQGTAANSAKVSNATFTSVYTFSAPVNLTNKCIYVWMMCATPAKLDTKANGGLRIRVADALGNWGEWYVAGNETYFGGWECFVVHTSIDFSNKSATAPTMSDITKAGVVCKTTSTVAKTNFWFDAMRYGTSLTVYGGISELPATFQDLVDAENLVANKYGIITTYAGLLLVQGIINIGSTVAGQATYFKDTTAKILIFRGRLVPSTFYELKLRGNSTATTEIYLGDKQGGAGVAGPIFRCEDITIPYKVTAADTNVTKFGFWACAFYNGGVISGQAYDIDKEFLDCTFFKSAQMEPGTGIVKTSSFVSTTGRAILMNSASHHITDSKFVNCQTAIHINQSVTLTIDKLNFYGNTYDIEHSVAGALTVNCTNSSNPPDPAKVNETGGGSTTIVNTKILTIRHVKTGNEPTEYARCCILKQSDNSEIMNQDAIIADDLNPTYYKAVKDDYSYPPSGPVAVIVRAREKGWLPFETVATITDVGLDIAAVWLPDPNYQP